MKRLVVLAIAFAAGAALGAAYVAVAEMFEAVERAEES